MVLVAIGCSSPAARTGSDSAKRPASLAVAPPRFRKQVNREPVAEWKEKTDDPLNDFYFTVRLYETAETFRYRVTMQFEEVRGEDTLIFPDFGIPPKPSIQKGKDRFSCIIGFVDRAGDFREYKQVSVEHGQTLRISTLHRYAVVVDTQ
jgi:hypothetical protein